MTGLCPRKHRAKITQIKKQMLEGTIPTLPKNLLKIQTINIKTEQWLNCGLKQSIKEFLKSLYKIKDYF